VDTLLDVFGKDNRNAYLMVEKPRVHRLDSFMINGVGLDTEIGAGENLKCRGRDSALVEHRALKLTFGGL